MVSKEVFLGNIDENSDMPLYVQLLSIIRRGIKTGLINEGDTLPSEAELCEMFNLSRSTVRHAIGELENEGLVIRRRGKGTFISKPKMSRKMEEVYSFSKEIRNMGLQPSSKILDFQIISNDIDLSRNLELKDSGDKIYKIVRLRMANEEPLLLETTYIPVYIIPGLKKDRLESESLYQIMREHSGIEPYEAEESYESVLIDQKTAALLNCKKNSSGFFIERKTLLQSGEVYEYTQSIMRGDKTKFVIRLRNKGIEFNREFDKDGAGI